MDKDARDALEEEIRRSMEQGDAAGAATLLVREYGPELLRFLLSLHRDEEDASEVFSLVAEGLWRGLPGFAWDSSLRTWAYAVARRASLRYRRDEGRRAKRHAPIEELSALSAIEEEVRTRTLTFLRSEVKSRFTELRDSLSPEDRALLFLRVDRGLAWNDLARAMHGGEDPPLEGEELKRAAARLRKRFQSVKDRLVEIGRSEGLIEPERRG